MGIDGALPQPDLDRLLEQTSRTFALAIPLLEPPLTRQVGLAYLLLRLADELEDAPLWGRDERREALASFARWLDDGGAKEWLALVERKRPTTSEGCLELFQRAEDVRAATHALASGASSAILAHTRRTAIGMAEFVARQDDGGGLVLADVADLRRYAYVVAGIVGELLTELFALAHPGVDAVRDALDADAAAFGEGLQLVNILKDAPADAREGRSYLPPNVSGDEVMALARRDLSSAERYVQTLSAAAAPPGIVAFCDLPTRLAVATLDRLAEGGSKLTREDVLRIYATTRR
jgi:farnesyl-diphosphate farnesyltransferase